MTGKQDVFQQAMNQGHSAAWDQLWDRAAAFYRQALEEFPDHPQALINLGLALFEQGQYNESLQVYQRAARVSLEDPLPMEKVANLYERIGDIQQASLASLRAAELYLKNRDLTKAIENWMRVTRLTPDNLQAHTRLAIIYERLGEKLKAVSEYLSMASLLQGSGDIGRAVRAVTQAMQIMPESEEAAEALSWLKESKPLPKPARPRGATAPLRMAQVRQLEVGQPDTVESRLDPIALACQKALTELAGMLFEGSDEASEDPANRRGLQSLVSGNETGNKTADRGRILLHLSQVVDLQTRGQNDQASEELARAIEAGLDHPAAWFDLGYLYAASGRPGEAQQPLQHALNQPNFSLGAHLLMADLDRKAGHLKEAAIHYLEALKLADSQVVRPERAEDLRQLYEPLIDTQSQQQDPDIQARLCENVSALLMRADWREQLSRARQQLPSQDPNAPPLPLADIITEVHSSQVIEALSTIYELARRGDLDSAMEEAFYALDHAPTYLPLHTYMAEILLKNNRLQEAITKFLVVAHAYSIRGEPNRAVDLYRRIIELAPMDLGARSQLMHQLISMNQIEEAINEYLELADVYLSLADLNMVRKTYAEALRLAQQMPRVDRSWRVKILHRIADIDIQSLDWRQAIRVFEQIRTLQPDDEKARSSLIELNFRLGQETFAINELDNYISYLVSAGQRALALRFVEAMTVENPERVSLKSRLAELYRQAGRTRDAIQMFDEVGDALLEAGDRAGAVRTIETILSLNPDNRSDYQKLLLQIKNK